MCNCSNIPSFCQIIKDPSPVFWYFVGWWCEYPSFTELGRKFACTRTIYPPVNLSQFPSAQVKKNRIINCTLIFQNASFFHDILTTFFQKLKRFQKNKNKNNKSYKRSSYFHTRIFSTDTWNTFLHQAIFYSLLVSQKSWFFSPSMVFFFKCLNCNLPD